MKDNIKYVMAKEFEKQIDDIVFSSNNESNFDQIIGKINYQKNCWKSCRFDLKNNGNEFNRINILDNDNSLHIDFPSWFRDYQGQGCKIEGDANKLNLKVQCVNDGNFRFYLKGVDYRNSQIVRVPVYINFTTFKLNDELIFNDDKFVWHDQPYTFEISSKDKDIFNIHLEFKTIYDYYPSFLNLFDDIHSKEELNDEYSRFKEQINTIHFFEHFGKINNSSLEKYNIIKDDYELILGNMENSSSYDSFLSHYSNYLNSLEIKDTINQLNSRIEFLENKIKNCENIIESDNEYFNTIFLNYTLKPNRLLDDVQTLCLELLSFINKVCVKYDVKWWLDYGTLLGSIRHENFIPWDDDIDIGMMRKDYHKFIGIIYDEIEKNNLSDYIEVGYRWRKFNGKDINSFLQFYMRDEKIGEHPLLAGVDVFPYDYMKNYDKNTLGELYNASNLNFYQTLCKGFKFSDLYMGLDYSEVIDNYYQELNLTYEEDNYILPGVEGSFGYKGTNLYELIVLKDSDIFPLKEYKFNEYVFPVPHNSHKYLNMIYGNNYMRVPKNMRTHDRLKLLRNVPDVYNMLESRIRIMKEANKNFKF